MELTPIYNANKQLLRSVESTISFNTCNYDINDSSSCTFEDHYLIVVSANGMVMAGYDNDWLYQIARDNHNVISFCASWF